MSKRAKFEHVLYQDAEPARKGHQPKQSGFWLVLWDTEPETLYDWIPNQLGFGQLIDLTVQLPSDRPLFVRPYHLSTDEWQLCKDSAQPIRELNRYRQLQARQ